MQFILIDGSYFIYHRYYSLKNWWKNAHRETETTTPFENERFIEKYKTTFVKKIAELKKIYAEDENPIVIVGKDCHSKDIWRRKLFKEYKYGRKKDDVGVKDSFKLAFSDDLFKQGGVHATLSDPNLEADDCIAITLKHLVTKYPDAKVTIITSDMDYLQLSQKNVRLFNLNNQELITSKHSFNNPEKDLFCKIVSGDKSDNIKSVFSRCGMKTAAKYYHDRDAFAKKLQSDPDARAIYELNKTLIDFNNIPQELVERFKKQCLKL
tara:strand:- start:284 stop:1081 length:798 start_codon:yes stop_codon:yes gene_type:complete